MPAHPQRGGARVGQCHDGLGPQVVGREQRAHGDGLVNAREFFALEVVAQLAVLGLFGFLADVGHLFDGLQRVLAGGGFGAEHHGVGAVEHGVGHVAHLGARGHRVDDHRLHHLRGGDHDLVHLARQADHVFLQAGHGCVAHLHRQIAARDHDAVGHLQDVDQLGDRLGALDLRNQGRFVALGRAGHVAQLARQLHVGRILGKAHRHVVGLQAHGGLDIVHVLGGERRRGQAAALLVDALVVRQLAAEIHRGVHRWTHHLVDDQHDQAVIEQQRVAGLHVAGELLVVQAHAFEIAQLGARGIEHEFFTRHQHHLALGKLAHADLGALQVGHDADLAPGALGRCAHQRGAVDVVLRGAVREVEANHVHARADHGFEQSRVAGSRAEGGNDLGGAHGHWGCLLSVNGRA
ncbi:hypothetical protein FQZ97_702590 [compost metagenome]